MIIILVIDRGKKQKTVTNYTKGYLELNLEEHCQMKGRADSKDSPT